MPSSSSRSRQAATEPPVGWAYVPDLIRADEEATLLAFFRTLPFEAFVFRGVEARRRVAHFGWVYEFENRELVPGPPVPEPLLALRGRAGPVAGREPERFDETLVTEYPPGATIGWHRDAPAFGSVVVGVSLASACRMRFRRRAGDGWETWEQVLEPRSAYVLSGAARSSWQHSIPPTPDLRYSVTYRTLRRRPGSPDHRAQ